MPQRIRVHFAWTTGAIIIKNGFYLAIYMLLARCIEPAAFGSLAIGIVGMGLALCLVDSGFASVAVRELQCGRLALSSLYWLTVALGIGGATILFAIAPVVSAVFGNAGTGRVVVTAALVPFFGAWGQLFLSILQRERKFVTIAIIDIAAAAIAFSVASLRALNGGGPASYFEGIAAGTLFSTVTSFFCVRSLFAPLWRFSLHDIRPFLRFGWYNTLERLVTFCSSNLEKPIAGRLLGMEVLGFYTVVSQLITRPVFFISNALSRVTYPVYAALQNDHVVLNREYLANSGKLAFVTFPVYGFIYLFSGPIITLLFGPRFLPAQAYVLPLCVLGAIWAVGNPFGAYLMALGRAKTGFYFNLISALITCAVFACGSRWGLAAMLWIWTGAVVAVLIPIEWTIRYRLTKMSFPRFLGKIAPHAVAVCAICLLVQGALCRLVAGDGLFADAGRAAAYAACYGAYALAVSRFLWKRRV